MEKLLDLPAKELEAITDAELKVFFAPFFPTTRPELAKNNKNKDVNGNNKPITLKNIPTDPAKRAAKLMAAEIAAKYGVKLKL